MDKLSNRFHAGELIRANAEAEARQMQSLKSQNEQLSEIITEARRLNLKTAEMTEQMSQMTALAIEKLEEYKAAQSAAPVEEAKKDEDIDKGSGWELEIYQGLSQLHTELQNVEGLESSLLTFQESQSEQSAKLTRLMEDALDAQNRPNSWQTEVWQSMSLMQQQLQNVEQLASSQASLLEQLQSAQNYYNDQKPSFVYEIEAILSELENVSTKEHGELREALDTLNVLSQRNAETDASAITGEISGLIDKSSESTAETLKQIKELVVSLRVYIDEVEKKCEDFVHKEDVKVYRNVQANVMETVSARSRDLSERLDSIEKRQDGIKGIKPLLVVTILLSLADLAINVLRFLGII